jgi:hypothetical protein
MPEIQHAMRGKLKHTITICMQSSAAFLYSYSVAFVPCTGDIHTLSEAKPGLFRTKCSFRFLPLMSAASQPNGHSPPPQRSGRSIAFRSFTVATAKTSAFQKSDLCSEQLGREEPKRAFEPSLVPATKTRRKRLQVLNQNPDPYFQCPGHPHERVETDPLLPPLDLANVHGMQIGLLRKLFLAQVSPVAATPNRITQNLQRWSSTRHSVIEKQAHAKLNTPNMGLFCSDDAP